MLVSGESQIMIFVQVANNYSYTSNELPYVSRVDEASKVKLVVACALGLICPKYTIIQMTSRHGSNSVTIDTVPAIMSSGTHVEKDGRESVPLNHIYKLY